MNLKERLERVAYNESIDINSYPISFAKSFILDCHPCSIAIDRGQVASESEEIALLAHELGHYFTGCLYNADSPLQTKGRCEYRANAWMVKALCPIDNLKKAIVNGCNTIWELADELSLSEVVINQAIEIYRCKGMI